MKKTAIILLVLLISGIMMAQYENLHYLPLAETDDLWSPMVNPAALGYGNSSGIGWTGEDQDGEEIKDYYSWIFNMENLAYAFHRNGTGQSPADRHTLAFGTSVFPKNLYLGTKYEWVNKYSDDGKWSLSGLWRPANFISFAAAGYNLEEDHDDYRLGVSIRPFGYNTTLAKKITLSTDYIYRSQEDEDAEWQKPLLSLSSEFVPGVYLSGTYDLENELVGANFSIALSNFRIGSLMGFDSDNEYSRGNTYFHFSEKEFPSIFRGFKKGEWYEWKLSGQITEQRSAFNLGPITISDKKQQTMSQIIKKIEKLKDDDNIKGIVFMNPSYSASFAARQELYDALMDFKAAGKKIVYYSDSMSSGEYYLAAAVSDAIYLNRNGGVDLKGMSVNVPYFKGLLDTLGIDITNFQSHEYKTAFNSFSYDHMTDAERETYEYLLNGLYTDMKKMIEAGRAKKLNASLDEIIDQGPYLNGNRAFDAGLVDYLIYEDELKEMIKDDFAAKGFNKSLPGKQMQVNWHKPQKDKIAVVYAVGSIMMGKGKAGRIIGSKTTAEAIRKARKDDSVKGIILRVDSGGGSAFASDVINREVELCRKENKKPVVASMAGVAASGGYYISSNADMILAQSSTITGSIGVIGMWPSFQRLYDKIHVNWATVKIGDRSDFGNTSRQPRKDEIELVSKYIEDTYNDFLVKVATGRSMSKDDVHKVAMGRVWTGSQALERGLIDKIGGMKEAVDEVKKLANIEREIYLVDYSGYDSDIDVSINLDGLSFATSQNDLPKEAQTILSWWDYYQQFKDEKAALITPIKINE